MRKIYVILTGIIYDIGGGQIYVNNKRDYLQKKGWEVHIFSYRYGKAIRINELNQYKNNIFRELKYPPCLLSEKSRIKFINYIIGKIENEVKINTHDEIIIESNTISVSMWGELIANKLNCKHISYLLYERFPKFSLSILKYLDFKHKRKELAGIIPESLNKLFNGYKTLPDDEKYYLKACVGNVVGDVDEQLVDNLTPLDFNIGCLSRLEKPFIMTLIRNIVTFANKYQGKKILLLFIGDSSNEIVKKNIITKFRSVKNVELVMLGAMYPVPKKIFSRMDIFFASAGAASICAHYGALTASIDVNTHKPIGYLGYDTDQTLYGDPNSNKSIFSVIEDILIKKNIPSRDNNYRFELIDYQLEFDKHMQFIASSDQNKKYYLGVSIAATNRKYFILKTLSKFIGFRGCIVLHRLYRWLTF